MDSHTVQTLLVAIIVGVAALFVGSRLYRTFAAARRRNKPGCGGDCGCSDGP